MKRVILIGLCLLNSLAYSQQARQTWMAGDLFQRNVFIENKGQFSKEEQAAIGDKILFSARKGSLFLYFTKTSLVFRYDSVYLANKGEEAEPENTKLKHVFMKMNWEGANNKATIEAQNEVSDYFTYGNPADKSGKTSVKANGFASIIYHNLYPGIDVKFYYPDGKEGLEYDIIVHPGSSLASVKMSYSNALPALLKNELHISFSGITITDHTPNAKDDKGNSVNVSFLLNKNTASFAVSSYDKNRILTIDPWYTSLSFNTTNKAYDLGHDLQGNVYVYGGQNTFQLQKYNSNGVLQWTYTESFVYNYLPVFNFYGDVTTDVHSGTSYLSEGYDPAGAKVIKVSSAGAQQAMFQGSALVTEFWRMNFDNCHNMLVIATGNTTASGVQCATLDTNFTGLDTANILGTTVGGHDMCLLGLDGRGSCYMATARSFFNFDTTYNNLLCKVPLPALKPTVFRVYDKHDFTETSSVNYYPSYGPGLSRYHSGNGFNGLAANPLMILTYDGGTLRKWRPSGMLADSLHVSPLAFKWGGLELDCGGNVYIGYYKQINVYDSALNFIMSLPMPDTIYDLAIGINQQVYACGNGYVASVTAPTITNVTHITFTYPSSCSACNGTATANPACGLPPYTYHWSNGATTQTITGLCAGQYTVTVTDATCPPWEDTAMVSISGKPNYYATLIDTNPSCIKHGSITALPSGGTSPYTYLWSNGATTQKDTGLAAGTYTLTLTDANGCVYVISTTLTKHVPFIVIQPKNDNICIGYGINLAASGADTYTWLPATGLSCTNCPNPFATPTVNTTYTVTGTDSNGCTASITVSVWVHQPPVITISPPNDTICSGSNTILNAGGAFTYVWRPSTGLSCDNCTNPTVFPTSNTTYTVIGTDIYGCVDSTTYMLAVTPIPRGTVTAPVMACRDSSVTLTATGGTSYLWSNGATTSSITVSPSATTTYTVDIKKGCVDILQTTVTVLTPIGNVCCPTTILKGWGTGLNVTPNYGVYNYRWVPSGSLSCSSCPNPYATPTVTTTYSVYITDQNGCTKMDTVTVEVKLPCPEPFVPNAFSPNNDGENDVLYVHDRCLASMHLDIFDRWGNKVFESENESNGWDGKYLGLPMNAGTYVYFLKYTLTDGTKGEKKGNVALVR